MRLRVLLVQPVREGDNIQISPDLGLLLLGTAISKQGFGVTLLDCPKNGMNFADFKNYLESGAFDVVGFRCFSRDHNYVKHHLKIVRQVFPKAITLVGGPHSSALPEFVLDSMPDLDFAWKSEAEEGLPSFLSLIEEYGKVIPEKLLRGVPGLAWRSTELHKNIVNAPGFMHDLDRYGIPEWELLKPETYPGFIHEQYYPVLTTRGCPYGCTYCNSPGLSGKKLRHRGVELVIEELRFLKKKYGIRQFCINDEEFTLDRDHALQFCEQLLKADLNLHWDCPIGVRLDSLNPELLQTMERAGCKCIGAGIESGNERIQKLIKKNITVETIREKTRMIADCGRIKVIGYFMLGFPDETEDEIMDTINLATELPLYHANFNLVIPVPGTALFDDAIREGKIKLDEIDWDNYTVDRISFPRKHVSGERLTRLQKLAYMRFYGRPRILWPLCREALRNRQVIRASIRNLKKLLRRTSPNDHLPLYIRQAGV